MFILLVKKTDFHGQEARVDDDNMFYYDTILGVYNKIVELNGNDRDNYYLAFDNPLFSEYEIYGTGDGNKLRYVDCFRNVDQFKAKLAEKNIGIKW